MGTSARRGVAVEGEPEAIRGQEAGVESAKGAPRPLEESLAFIEATGIDSFAPYIGNAHGRSDSPVFLNVDRVVSLTAASRVAMVLHGGTGLAQDVIHSAIDAGITKINVSTAIREAYLNAVREHASVAARRDDLDVLFNRIDASVCVAASKHIQLVRSAGHAPAPGSGVA